MKKGAVITTSAAVVVCALILLGTSIAAPALARIFADFRMLSPRVETVILIAYYVCTIPAFGALWCLWRLLKNIRMEEPFKRENMTLMGIVSYCCIMVAAVTLWAGFYYMPMWFIMGVMLFTFLIVRVVRGCFICAMHIKEENSLTI